MNLDSFKQNLTSVIGETLTIENIESILGQILVLLEIA